MRPRLYQLGKKLGAPVLASTTAGIYLYQTMAPSNVTPRADAVPDHHCGNSFRNPWPSAPSNTTLDAIKMFTQVNLRRAAASVTEETKPRTVEKMNWDLINAPQQVGNSNIVVTWLGHACALVQLNGFNILYDPIFSDRCSPLSFAGPKRVTQPPCRLDELPRIDAIIISHNHYDHLDVTTMQSLADQHPNVRIYVPLGNKAWFANKNYDDRVTEMDWWDHTTLTVHNDETSLKITCTPCQHFSGRGILDRNKTLWASWAVEGMTSGKRVGSVYFGGDTGYRTIPPNASDKEYDEEYLDTLPHCPAFKEIGDRIGPFDLSLIPIGAYSPRWFMSTIHCSPEDAVRVHEDVRSKRSIGIHWGTFILTDEDFNEPPRRLKDALKNRKHSEDEFNVLNLGETAVVSVSSK